MCSSRVDRPPGIRRQQEQQAGSPEGGAGRAAVGGGRGAAPQGSSRIVPTSALQCRGGYTSILGLAENFGKIVSLIFLDIMKSKYQLFHLRKTNCLRPINF